MISRILNSKTKTITFAAFLLSLAALFSRLLGMLRDNLLANLFPKNLTDIYFASFRIPDFLYGILITGGIIAAFLPVFSESFKKSEEEAKLLSSSVLTFFLLLLSSISFVLAIFTPQLIKLIAPGFDQSQKETAVLLTRIMFLSPILLGISAIFSSILRYFNLFLATALAPILYNIGIIVGILFFAPSLGLKGLALGVIFGAFLHLLIQIPPLIKAGFLPRFTFNFKSSGLKKIIKLSIPRTLGTAAYHLNLIVITSIASTLSAGSISVFNFANNLQSVPAGIIGISFAQAAFPFLSRTFAGGEKEKFLKNFSSVFSKILFLIIPLSALVFLLRAQIVRLVLGTSILGEGYFGWSQTRLTAASLGVFSLALFAAAAVPFLARVFFSFQDTKTPVKIAVFSMVLNVSLCYLFVWALSFTNFFQRMIINLLKLRGIKDISVIGLPLALSISVIFQFFFLVFYLKKKSGVLDFKNTYLSLKKILLASFLMTVFSYLTLNIYALIGSTNTVLGILLQTVLTSIVAIFSYLVFSFLLKIKEARAILSLIANKFEKRNKNNSQS